MIYGKRSPERAICAILPPLAGCPWRNALCFARSIGQRTQTKPAVWSGLLSDFLFHSAVFPRPTDAGKVHVATANSGEFRIGSLPVVRVLVFLAFALEAEAAGVKSGHDASVFKRAATAIAFFLREEFVWHFSVLLRLGFGFRGVFRISRARLKI